MSDQEGFSHQLADCARVRTWARQAQQVIDRLMRDPRIEHQWGMRLVGLRHAVSGLAGQAEWHLSAAAAGLFNPVTLPQLLTQAQQSISAFDRFMQETGVLTRKERRSLEPVRPVPIGEHVLPRLPYPYDALEPYIDEKTMRLHHQKHHQTYVDGLNKAEVMMARARETGDFDLLKHWEREAAFHGAGHYLHTIFWKIMSPKGGGEPSGALAEEIARSFGSYDRFKAHFSAAAEKVEGVGWAILVWSPRSHRMEILQAEKHQDLSQWDVIPLLVLDVWEHAYYLTYQNDRKSYIEAWWNVVNWEHVAERFAQARTLVWEPF